MKVTPDRIEARREQLRNQGFRIRNGMVRATLELNAGANWRLNGTDDRKPDPAGTGTESHKKSKHAA